MILPKFEAIPTPPDEGIDYSNELKGLLSWCYHIMHDTLSITWHGFTFNMWDIFVCVIIFSFLGYIVGKLLNPWSHDDE